MMEPERTPELTVIIPTYDRCDLLAECLASLAAQTCRDFDVLIVDDGSAEDIAACVHTELPGATVLRREENGGFARAVNGGLRWAATPFLMLLNNDMTLEPDAVERLMENLRESGAGMAGPLVLFRDRPDLIYSTGDRILPSGRPESIGFRERRDGFSVDRRPFGLSAGAAIYRREIFETVGLFDERYIAYFEDADLCLRARKAGFEAICVPEAVAYHVGSASLNGRTAWRTRQCYRNHALLVAKNYGAKELARYAPAILRERLHQARMLIGAYRAEAGLAAAIVEWSRALSEVLRLMPATLLEPRQARISESAETNVQTQVAGPQIGDRPQGSDSVY